jgi:outer membrane protein OmpA-like peptidoglycan-associated protein
MKVLIIFLSLMMPLLLTAQDFNKLIKTAEKQFYAEKFEEALKTYNDILYINPKNTTALYRSEICSLMTNFSDKSVEKLILNEKNLGEKDRFYNYWLGHIYKKQGKFDEAKESWEKFQSDSDYKSPLITLETESLVEEVTMVIDQKKVPINYEIEPLDKLINSNKNELSPTFIKSSNSIIYFSSISSKNKSYQLFSSKYFAGGWEKPSLLNSPSEYNENDASIGLVETNAKTFIYSDLYYIEYKNNEWGSKVITAESAKETHLFMNSDETKMFFSANISGALDNLDLFMVVQDKETGIWSEPKRLNDNINTHYDEDYPFLSQDEKSLYFSSKGLGSIGGYDIFKCEFNDEIGDWSKPTTLNNPINSTGDDIQFKLTQGSNSGFFSSNRSSIEKGYDIYLFHDIFNVNFEGIVIDEKGNPVSDAIVSLYSSNYISKRKELVTNEKGIFKTSVGNIDKLNIKIKLNKDVLYSDQVLIQEDNSGESINISKKFLVTIPKEIIKAIDEDTVKSSDTDFIAIDNLGSKFRLSKKALIPNINFGFNEHDISKSGLKSLEILISVLNQYPDLNIEIAGHTDNFGSEKINVKISERRSHSVYKYLISKGIKKNRLQAKGYGESKPVASNDYEENGRNLNRRIEIIVVE